MLIEYERHLYTGTSMKAWHLVPSAVFAQHLREKISFAMPCSYMYAILLDIYVLDKGSDATNLISLLCISVIVCNYYHMHIRCATIFSSVCVCYRSL
jgi:hypothetical protein